MEYRGGLREYERENMLPLQEEKLAKAKKAAGVYLCYLAAFYIASTIRE